MALHVQGLPNELNRLTDAKMKVSVGVVFVVSVFFWTGSGFFFAQIGCYSIVAYCVNSK